jgi:type II secretory pathway pseudopilin PulG
VRGARGFTLIELLVVTGIMILIAGLILVNNNKFGGKILLENLAYDMALTVRKAQIYGISVLRSGSGTYTSGYGMHFSVSTPTSYTLFADAVQTDGLYTAGEQVESFSIDHGYRIEKLCAPAGTDITTCQSVNQLDVLYKRPEPDAWISANGNSCIVSQSNCQESARVGLVSPVGDRTNFVVDINGQVSVITRINQRLLLAQDRFLERVLAMVLNHD